MRLDDAPVAGTASAPHALARLGPSPLMTPVAVGGGLAVAAAYVYARDPSSGGFLPCPLRAATGLWCPGCGMTRAVHHLLHGRIDTALQFNAFVVVAVAAIATAWVLSLVRATGREITLPRPPAWTFVAAICLLVAFAVVRNLPTVDGLRG